MSDLVLEYAGVVEKANENVGSMGLCGKQMEFGDVAWRCMDCEKDPTCIICKSCFEKGDHTGHRVQLKRNVGGCCDCGDPEAWDPDHFCSDHKGYEQSPEEIMSKLSAPMRQSAEQVFREICISLKEHCMTLLHSGHECGAKKMEKHVLEKVMGKLIHNIIEFLNSRVDEIPAFLYIIDQNLNKVFFEEKFILQEYHECCLKCFAEPDDQKEFNKQLEQANGQEYCTCSTLDLCLQSNYLLSTPTKKIVYDFIFKLFQSYTFKQNLTLSFGANYEKVMCKMKQQNYDISTLSVQVMTSAEMTMLLLKNQGLIDNMLRVFDMKLTCMANEPQNEEYYVQCHTIIHDLKYLARPECLQFCIQNTTLIEQLIQSYSKVYLSDTKEPRTSMIAYMQEGGPNEELLNIELILIKVLNMYLKEIKHNDIEKNRSILSAFLSSFDAISKKIKDQKKENHGIYILPLHRSFAYYFTRLMFFNYIDPKVFENEKRNLPLSAVFRKILEINLPKEYWKLAGNSDSQKEDGSQQKMKNFRFGKGKYSFGIDNQNLIVQAFDNQDDIELGSSLVENAPSVHERENSITCLLKTILKTQIQQISFIQEINAKKWVLYGDYLQHYPTIYFRVNDRLSYQDFANFQILLSLDSFGNGHGQESLTDYLISTFGLDNQLQTLFNCLKEQNLEKSHFSSFKRFDSQKLRLQLTFFLCFLAQLCVHESAYLKQIFNRKEDKADTPAENHDSIKAMWTKAMKKEAVHLLMLNKNNVGIKTLKEDMLEIFQKDNIFEEMLFEVSSQSRDQKNQVTFKLKDEYYGWFDPYFYVLPDQHSQVFQMYEQNELKEKFVEQGLNDVVGDYTDKYSYVSGLNQQLMENLAQSGIIQIIVPLLTNWLIYRKNPPEQVEGDLFGTGDPKEEEKKSLMTMLTYIRGKNKKNGEEMKDSGLMEIIRRKVSENLDEEDAQITEQNEEPQAEINQEVLNKFVDPNVANNCLKLLVIILKSKSTSQCSIYFTPLLIRELIIWKTDSENDIKLKSILVFILNKLYSLTPDLFPILGDEYCYDPQETGANVKNNENDKQKLEKAENKKDKDKLKKRQAKLMAKMKKKGNDMLQQKQNADTDKAQETTAQSQEETYQCAFCQEELRKENFISNPYGNFVYCQTSKLMYYALEQTIASQEKALKNEDLTSTFNEDISLQVEEEKVSESNSAEKDFHEFQELIDNQINSHSDSNSGQAFMNRFLGAVQKQNQKVYEAIQPNPLVQILCNGPSKDHSTVYSKNSSINDTYLNKYTGSASMISNCKHYSHVECLRKYHLEQEGNHEHDYQKRISGLRFGEFQCPVCKSINNGIMPSLSLEDACKLDDFELTEGDDGKMSDKALKLLDFYMDLLSEIIKVQQGYARETYKQLTQKSTVLKDVRLEPQRIMSTVLDHFVHRIQLIDVIGLKNFIDKDVTALLSNIHSSLKKMLVITSQAKHQTFEVYSDFKPMDFTQMVLQFMQKYVQKELNHDADGNEEPIFSKNLGISAIKTLLLSAFISSETDSNNKEQVMTEHFNIILRTFYPILRFQFLYSLLWRQSHGKLRQAPISTLEEFQSFQVAVKEDSHLTDLYCQIELHTMRKLFLTVHVLRKTYLKSPQDDQILKKVMEQTSDIEELKIITEYLQLTEVASNGAGQITSYPSVAEDQQSKSVEDEDQPMHFERVDDQDEELRDPFQENVQQSSLLTVDMKEQVDAVEKDEILDIRAVMEGYRTKSFLTEKLSEFSTKISTNKSGHKKGVIEMPKNLVSMTLYYHFGLYEIPKVFLDYQQIFYKRKCCYCNQEKQDTATCLLDGKTMCWFKVKDGQCQPPGREANEGLLSYHTRVHQGGCAIFMQQSTGQIVMIQNGNSAMFETPYRNKYGELAHPNDKRWDSFKIDQEGGGEDALRWIQQQYVEFKVGNTILQQRTDPDSHFKVYLKNAL